VWVLIITDGTVVEFPIEIYTSHSAGVREAERWAWTLAGQGEIQIDRPFTDRWTVGVRDVRLVGSEAGRFSIDEEWWVGTHWTADGYPDPEAHLLNGRSAATAWVLQEPSSQRLNSSEEREWSIAATFGQGDDESISIASLAKVIVGSSNVARSPTAEYQVELTGTFVQAIRSSIFGPAGLPRDGIERLVEEKWSELSAEGHVLLESSWELDDYRELPRPGASNP
jgi:hypothetical protein